MQSLNNQELEMSTANREAMEYPNPPSYSPAPPRPEHAQHPSEAQPAQQVFQEQGHPLREQPSNETRTLRDRVAAFKLGPDASGAENELHPDQSQSQQPPRELTLEEQSLPIVIPQTTSKFNAFDSPFVRCYPENLRYKNIDQETFLAFLDGLNEAFITNPVVQPISIAGAVMQQFYGMSTVQYVGAGVQFGAGLVSSAISYGRTRAYMKAINVDLFHPAGLSATILKAKKMTDKIGYGPEKLRVTPDLNSAPTKDEVKAGMSRNNAIKSRMKALEGHVAELNLDVPEATQPENLLRRMGASQAKRVSAKQDKKSDKKLAKAKKRADKVERKVEKRERKMERKIEELESQGRSEATIKEMERTMRDGKAKIQKVQNKGNKRIEKLEKTQSKSANKMRWIVITPWQENDDSSDESKEEREAELSSTDDEE